ncbi:ABC transporter ATP-binding protein [Marinomonas pollencensis]|uniref:ABC-type dipeptide transporter n=1 Tax=Marinomonas pollencensis TaxID=491954 RepID=A0A3E0DPR8_9GAMM|nr:ABC transporter ATP-binding protein [Marinomonas pollencensis]REG84930.1 peptide/nickel transport system ATP-binding protein [Marinomonas pollencensis]
MVNQATKAPLLAVNNLNIRFPSVHGAVHAVRDVSFTMGREKVAIVGESGSGKSQTGRAILGLSPGQVSADSLIFDGIDLQRLSSKAYREIRGKRISMVMQDPKYSLNPVMSIGKQMIEACQIQMKVSKKQALARCMQMLEAVRIRQPQRVFKAYPHEVSGGMGQRIMIAMMLLSSPDLLIADEPTSALDVTVQLQILAIMDDLVQDTGMGLILISHDLPLVASFCDRILVMYAGRIVEELDASKLDQAQHPYTRGLLSCLPSHATKGQPLATLERQDSWLDEALENRGLRV